MVSDSGVGRTGESGPSPKRGCLKHPQVFSYDVRRLFLLYGDLHRFAGQGVRHEHRLALQPSHAPELVCDAGYFDLRHFIF